MDHTVYERKNTDLGSTSMTKSGGFSIKKRHRKLGALIGLAALAVPFAANLGTLGDTIHAVTGPQNVYESELLNVKLKTSQDKAKTTWDLEFDRSDMSVSEQTVKFKLDLEKAGLKDAEIKQDDKTLDMREGIVSAVLKSQSTHLILTAISTNEEKHDITLPVTELGLYDEKNGENRLEADNRSVDLTMAFEKVAEIAKESSSSETVTEAVAKEETETKESKSARAAVNPGTAGWLTAEPTRPSSETTDVVAATITKGAFAGVDANHTTNTNFDQFQIYVNHTNDSTDRVSYYDGAPRNATNNEISVVKKANLTASENFGWSANESGMADVYNYWYFQYQKNGTSDTANPYRGSSSYLVQFAGNHSSHANTNALMANTEIAVRYGNVGNYRTADGQAHQMGAVMTIKNIQSTINTRFWDRAYDTNLPGFYIDIPNNMYSGLFYRGIEQFDVDYEFFATDDSGKFTQKLDIPENATNVTFNSLNNYQVGLMNQSPASAQYTHNVNSQVYGPLNSADYAETVAWVKNGTEQWASADLSKGTNMTRNGAGTSIREKNTVFSNVMGTTGGETALQYNLNNTAYTGTIVNWRDNINYPTSFAKGSITYPYTGTSNNYRYYSGSQNTWQTFILGSNTEIPLLNPVKAVSDHNKKPDVVAGEIDKTTSPKTYGRLDQKNLAETDLVPDAANNYNFSYYIQQDTYALLEDSLVLPSKLIMTDELPQYVTLAGTTIDTNTQNYNGSDVQVYSTAGTKLQGSDYTVAVSKVLVTPETGEAYYVQKVVVTLTEQGIKDINFNGGTFQWELQVKVDASLADQLKVERVDFKNIASVETSLATKETNPVLDWETPHIGKLVITKVDERDNSELSGAEFDVYYKDNNDTSYTKIDSADWASKGIEQSDATLTFVNPAAGTYKVVETTAPGGYNLPTDANARSYEFKVHNDNTNLTFEALSPEDWDLTAPKAGEANVWTANIENERIPLFLDIYKTDGDGNPLAGAVFAITRVESKKIVELDATGDDGYAHLKDKLNGPGNVGLELDKVYKVSEITTPSGYTKVDDFYFKATAVGDVFTFTYTDVNGNPIFGAKTITATKSPDGTYYVGKFEVDNYAKSIFPRVGGTGIQAYIGAGLIVMLIAGGAAWYIKRRQNQ